MIHEALHRPIPVELTEDPRIRRRVRRLAAVSAVALGLIWWLAVATTAAPTWVAVTLFAGWLSMPTVLLASLRDSRLRYGLAVPSVLVSLGLLAIVVGSSPGGVAGLGWLLILVGVLLGGLMGLWFWFRVVPVPGRAGCARRRRTLGDHRRPRRAHRGRHRPGGVSPRGRLNRPPTRRRSRPRAGRARR